MVRSSQSMPAREPCFGIAAIPLEEVAGDTGGPPAADTGGSGGEAATLSARNPRKARPVSGKSGLGAGEAVKLGKPAEKPAEKPAASLVERFNIESYSNFEAK